MTFSLKLSISQKQSLYNYPLRVYNSNHVSPILFVEDIFMAVSGIIFQMISLFVMIFAGYASARAGLITPDFRRGLSSLVLSTAFPCCIVSAVLQSGGAPSDMIVALGVSVAFFALMIALAAVLVCVVPTPKEERNLDQLLLVFTNLAFMGIPIIQALYGVEGVAMLSMFLLVFNFLVFTYGVMLLDGNGGINLKQLVNPGVISALIALLFGLTGWRLPSPVESALASIGSINTPMAMMIIGASLAHSDIRAAFTNPRLYRVAFLRLIVMPLVFIGLALIVPINRMLAGLCVIVAAMPIAGNCSMLSDIYTPEDMTSSHATIVSTLISGVTLPLLVLVMNMVGLG